MDKTHKSESKAELSSEDSSHDPRCRSYGWLGYRPTHLQSCLSPRWILLNCCLLIFTQAFVVTGISGVVVTSIEKRFFLRSSQIGVIFAFYEVGSIIFTALFSYFGNNHKPKCLGLGALVLGFGCLTFSLPQLLVGPYEPVETHSSDLCADGVENGTFPGAAGNSTEAALRGTVCKDLKWYSVFVLVVGQLVVGAGASPIFNLGAKYVEENTSRRNSGVFLGIFYSFATCGTGIGFLIGGYFLAVYVDVVQVGEFKKKKNRTTVCKQLHRQKLSLGIEGYPIPELVYTKRL